MLLNGVVGSHSVGNHQPHVLTCPVCERIHRTRRSELWDSASHAFPHRQNLIAVTYIAVSPST
eukprot:5967068-Pyramimonas_sp.AAC.1